MAKNLVILIVIIPWRARSLKIPLTMVGSSPLFSLKHCGVNMRRYVNQAPQFLTNNSLQALKEAQLKVNDLQITVRKLHMQNADLAMRLKALKGQSTTTSSGTKTKISESDTRISQFAKLFGVMHEPFIPPSAFLVECPNTSSAHPNRYESDLSKVQGITAELYEVLPNDMHLEIKSSPKFRSTVCFSSNLLLCDTILNIFSSLQHS